MAADGQGRSGQAECKVGLSLEEVMAAIEQARDGVISYCSIGSVLTRMRLSVTLKIAPFSRDV
jgi:dihydroxyacetone kinase DhaKLM complex PTS-EIIA-like component DhaM